MTHLDFLFEIRDEEKRRDYVRTLLRIAAAERESDEWRASYPFPPKNNRYPWIPAKPGYINKLEIEGLVDRTYSSNSTTRYTLRIAPDTLRRELNEVGTTMGIDIADIEPFEFEDLT